MTKTIKWQLCEPIVAQYHKPILQHKNHLHVGWTTPSLGKCNHYTIFFKLWDLKPSDKKEVKNNYQSFKYCFILMFVTNSIFPCDQVLYISRIGWFNTYEWNKTFICHYFPRRFVVHLPVGKESRNIPYIAFTICIMR